MTVSYQYDVASSTSGGFIRLLFRWRGSVWKLVYQELLFFSATYFILTMLYRFLFTEFQKRIFERIVFLCSTFMDLIPLSFVLGFYVSFIATRWWNQYTAIPWPDKLMNSISLYVPGSDETSRVLRRTMMRYLNVSLVLVLRSISMAVKRRFPTRDHLVEAGFMTKLELEMLNSVPSTEFNTFWIPCTWFINLLREAKQECRITDSNGLKLIMEVRLHDAHACQFLTDLNAAQIAIRWRSNQYTGLHIKRTLTEFNEFRSKCGLLWSYDWISIPLVYTQVVTLATYAFFGACIFGRQYVDSPDKPGQNFELYIPIFTLFQLFFYMGLLKVAEQLINPFGDDDEDFELNWIIDRHIKVSYLGVDILNSRPPPLVRDSYFYQQDMKLPYTEASVGYKKKTYRGSVARMQIPQEKQNLLVPEFSEDDEEDKIAATLGMKNRGASLWTLVGGQLNTRFSVSNQNLDTVTLESGSNNWKVSNPSLFVRDGFTLDDKQAPGSNMWPDNQLLHIPEEIDGESEGIQNVNPQPQFHRGRRASEVPKKAFKVVKKVVVPLKKPHRKKGGAHPQRGWVAFQSAAARENDNEILSLFKDDGQDIDFPRPSMRRQSFDVRGMSDLEDRTTSRFQSMPDVKSFALERDDVDVWAEEDIPEDQDNLSTANLLLIYEGIEEDLGEDLPCDPPPAVIFTRASTSPDRSTDSKDKEKLGSDQEDNKGIFFLPSDTEMAVVDSENKDTTPEKK